MTRAIGCVALLLVLQGCVGLVYGLSAAASITTLGKNAYEVHQDISRQPVNHSCPSKEPC